MISAVVKFPIVFISGVFIPLDELPTWAQAIAYFSPLTYFTDIARYCIVVLLAFTVLFITIAMRFHHRTMPRRI
jgi:ABC-2 type transport system permease protein